ncbi:phosphate ABC transporter permease PstA [Ahrensia sp. R2A130]|uniref:phosphate ABC transporter permease PstA n=1 Tax=Ahrensia sp. R2A130 TaxID=744979 RepID=UPI0001E0ACEE|nr:phosphate ABC transporter permease PstA [Ahrensia sp. R2A130]EFL87745.1 phosphate ABC transporter, permease protein PstA [Ahrensia sp. R2A130]
MPSPASSILRSGPTKRSKAETRFKMYGLAAIILSLGFLALMVTSIVVRGTGAFQQSFITLDVAIPADVDVNDINAPNWGGVLKKALRERFPDAKSRNDKRSLYRLVSSTAEFTVRDAVAANPALIGTTAPIAIRASSDIDMLIKGNVDLELPENQRRVTDQQAAWLTDLQQAGVVETSFNKQFFTGGDSREPEQAGIWGAVVGSFLSLMVCFTLAFPLGTLAAVYLEEFAPKGRISQIIEVNINNLAAVPSIVFGLLGLAIFLNFFDLPRSTPLVGGMVLALMTLPTIIIASRASLRAVPPSIREAAYGLGASKVQTTFHHVVPLAIPGMLTGSIIGMAQALGETAPLLMIGMVAFIVDIPSGVLDAATALPVQIFLWADAPDRGFLEKTSAAIMVLLGFLIIMNIIAIVLRKKLEVRW